MISYIEIVSKLQIYNCCLVQKGIEAIECKKKGKTPDYSDIELMNNLIKSLQSCLSAQAILPAPITPIPGIPAIPVPVPSVPVSPIKEIYSSADPIKILFTIQQSSNGISWKNINYPTLELALANRTQPLAYHITEWLNCNCKQFGYTARNYNYIYIAIFGYQYELDNYTKIKIVAKDNGNTTTLIDTTQLVGGVANCCPNITETLEKLDKLCNKPCNDIVNTF